MASRPPLKKTRSAVNPDIDYFPEEDVKNWPGLGRLQSFYEVSEVWLVPSILQRKQLKLSQRPLNVCHFSTD